jgi:hypothetical protein
MSDIFAQIGSKNTQNVDKRKQSSDKPSVKIIVAILVLIGVVIAALLKSPWLPQIWDKIKGF